MSSKSSLLALISYLELGKQAYHPPTLPHPNLTYFPSLPMEIVLLPKLVYSSCHSQHTLLQKKLMVVLSLIRVTAVYYYTWNTGHLAPPYLLFWGLQVLTLLFLFLLYYLLLGSALHYSPDPPLKNMASLQS